MTPPARPELVVGLALAAGAVGLGLWYASRSAPPVPVAPPGRADRVVAEPLPPPAALVWMGPVNLAQVGAAAELADTPAFNLTCTGDGSPSCGQIADSWKGADGRRLPAMRRALKLPAGPLMLAAFSAGGHVVRRVLQHPADRAEIAGVWLADATYTTSWADKKAGIAAPIQEFVEYAKEAARARHLFVATASSSPNKDHPTGAQTLAAIRAAVEAAGVRGSAPPASVLPRVRDQAPALAWRADDVWFLDYAGAFAHGEHATVIAPALWPVLVAPRWGRKGTS